MKQNRLKLKLFLILFMAANIGTVMLPLKANALTRSITFPVIGPATYVNDYYYPRGNIIHGATDIMARKGQKLVAAVSGTIINVNHPMPNWGWSVTIEDSAGWDYTYIHMNDDTPGTNDGNGGPMNAYAVDVQEGNVVVKGQLLGWVGDSGKSNGVAHLHFEMENPSGQRVNPYDSLRAAKHISAAVLRPKMPNEIMPFKADTKVFASIAMGNFDADPASELVVGAGKGYRPVVNVYDDNDTILHSFYAYDPNFLGGVDVGTGDVDGNGIDEVITGAGPGGSPHVKVLNNDGSLVTQFFAYVYQLRTGVYVDGGDIDDDGNDEIITGPRKGAGPHVRAFDSSAMLKTEFWAYDQQFLGGADVTSANVTGDDKDEIITGAGPGGGPHIKVFDNAATELYSFFAYGMDLRSGVRVSAADVDTSTPEAEILTVPSINGTPRSKLWTADGTTLKVKYFLEPWWYGNYDVAAGSGTSKGATGGNRRASVRLNITSPL